MSQQQLDLHLLLLLSLSFNMELFQICGCIFWKKKTVWEIIWNKNVTCYLQRDRSPHCDHAVQEVQWVPADRLLRPFQQGRRVRVIPKLIDSGKSLMKSTRGTRLLSHSGRGLISFISTSTHSCSRRSSRSSGTLVSSLTLNTYE